MRKIICTIILGFLMFIPNVFAANDVILENRVDQNQVILDIVFKNDIKGLTGTLDYNKDYLQIKECNTISSYNVDLKNNIIVIDNYEVSQDDIVAQCIFDIKKKSDQQHEIKLKNIKMSIKEKLVLSDDVVVTYKINNIAHNSNINIQIIIILLIIITFIISIILLRNKRLKMSLIMFLLLCPTIIEAYTLKTDDITNYRELLLSNDKNYMESLDLDNDKIITINDLVLARISLSKPVPIFEEKEVIGNNEYKTSVIKHIYVNKLNKVVKARYCITSGEKCSPDTTVNIVNNGFDIKLNNNKEAQKICVYVENKNGFSNEICDNKTYKVDNSEPTIKVLNKEIGFNLDDKFNPYNNIDVKYGLLEGSVNCSESLKLGKNKITCEAINKNGNNTVAEFIVNASYTYNKKAVFYGDSITYGRPSYKSGNKNYSWVNYIKDNYDLEETSNRGKNGWTVSNVNGTAIYKLIDQDKEKQYDYIILQGGCNDVYYDVPLGSYKEDDYSGNYNSGTFTGGLETYLYKATKEWKNAKIGYIITYKTSYADKRPADKTEMYYNQLIKVLKKWNISYLDLYDGQNSFGKRYSEDILKTNVLSNKYAVKEWNFDYRNTGTYGYTYDNLHLSKEGYKVISPYIYNWMNSLSTYKR